MAANPRAVILPFDRSDQIFPTLPQLGERTTFPAIEMAGTEVIKSAIVNDFQLLSGSQAILTDVVSSCRSSIRSKDNHFSANLDS